MRIHNKNLRESGKWEDYTDGADMYSPEFEQQQELTELERERFDSLSLAGQIAEVTGTDAEEIQIVLDEAAENDYPNQVVLESLQEIFGISEDEMISKVLPILRDHGFEDDYTADHYDIGDDEEDVIFESIRTNSKKRVKEATNKYIIKYRDYDADKEIHTDSFAAKNKRLNERFSSVEEERDAVEKFCILMDWEIKPEDVLHCVKNSDGNFIIQTENGDQFTYDPVKDCLRESQKRVILAAKNKRITEAYSANRGSATKSYAEMHPEMNENSKTTFLKNKLREAKSPKAKEYYLKRLKEERIREASYKKFELPKKATPGDKDYNPDEPGKKPAKRDWTSGKMKSVNGIYGRRAWTTKESSL